MQASSVPETGNRSVLVFHKQGNNGQVLTVIGNFSDRSVELPAETVSILLAGKAATDLLYGRLVIPGESLELEPCELLWVSSSHVS
jgi:hypothetical protein